VDVEITSATVISFTHEQLSITFPENKGTSQASGTYVTIKSSTNAMEDEGGTGEDDDDAESESGFDEDVLFNAANDDSDDDMNCSEYMSPQDISMEGL
jgi:hypothetical protein